GRVADRAHVEADDHGVRGGGEHDVGLVDPADAAVDDVDRHLLLRQLGDLVLERFDRPGHVALDDQRELLELALPGALEDVLERDLAARAAGERLALEALGALGGQLAGAAVVLDDVDELAGLWDAVEAEHLDRVAGLGLLHALALEVAHRAHAAPVRAGDDRVADVERAALDEDRHDGAAPRVELGLDDHAGGLGVGVGLDLLQVGDDLDRLQQVLEALLGLGRDVDELDVAAPLRRVQAALGHLRAGADGVGALLVDLVDRDGHGDLRRLGVVDRLLGLRLHAVVGGHDDDRDVGGLGAAGAHGGERLVARGVQEGDRVAVVLGLVGADVLGDPAGLAGGDLR